MQYIILDLEWNGGYSKKAHGYFNEIIEVGAVKLDERMRAVDEYQAEIRPVVSRKLSTIVTDLTNITPEDLEDGTTFAKMVKSFGAWCGEDAAVLTWSTTDLMVLMENCRFFYGKEEIPFLRYYADLQAYVQKRMNENNGGQQLGLSKAAQMLGIPEDGMSLHRALDDSRLSVQILQKVGEVPSLAAAVTPANEEFYARLTFKSAVISDINNPLVTDDLFVFACPECGRELRRAKQWRFHSRAFCSELRCKGCKKNYRARVQVRLTYDGVKPRRSLNEIVPKEKAPAPAEGTETPTEETV